MGDTENASPVGSEEAPLIVLLLCNNQSEKNRVLSLVMGIGELDINEPQHFLRFRVLIDSMKKTEMVLVVTPDLLLSKTTEKKTREMMESCVSRCSPGPHVFLLVLQPEIFTEHQQQKISSVLQMFSEESYHRTVILELSPLQENTPEFINSQQQNFQIMDEMTQKCQNRVLYQQNFEHSKLMKAFRDILGENHGEPLSRALELKPTLPQEQPSSSAETGSSLRIVLLGESQLCELLCRSKDFKLESRSSLDQSSALHGRWSGTSLTLVRTSNIYDMERKNIRKRMKACMSLCHPGPNLLLLLVKPSNFTKKKRLRLNFILGLFGEDAFQRSLVMMNDEQYSRNLNMNRLLDSCGERCLRLMGEHVGDFVEKMKSVIGPNHGFLSISENKNTDLNLLLCGSSRRLKASAVQAFSDQTDVSVVELPALFGKSQQMVMEESLRCVSQPESQRVHVFIVVLPAVPLTDDDKKEIEKLQKTFGPQLFDLALIVFSVESESTAANFLNFLRTNEEIQQLCERCGERADVFNLQDKNQISELMDMVDELRCLQPSGYTTEMFAHVQIEKMLQLEKLVKEKQEMLQKLNITGEVESQSKQSLRIVLLGKIGNGKSSSGNTILGRQVFESSASTESVTKRCEKVKGDVDGRPVFVVDTPGLFGRSLTADEINDELVKCISILAPGPHVFLLVLPIGRFTLEDEETLKLIRKGFGKGAEKFTIVLFTKGDTLKREKLSIKDYIQKSNDSFKKLISDCGERVHVFNNYEEEKSSQVSELIEKIDAMVRENGGRCFTNMMLQEAEAAIQKEVRRSLKNKEEEMEREQQELERKHKTEIQEMNKRIEEQRAEIICEQNLREKQLKKMEDYIILQETTKLRLELRDKEEERRIAEEELQRQAWKENVEKIKQDINLEKALEKKQAEIREARAAYERERVEREKENLQRQLEKFIEISKLKNEYKLEKEKLDREAKEEEGRREQKEENQRKELEEKHRMSEQQMKGMYQEKARTQAEEFNEFKEKYNQELKEKLQQIKETEDRLDFMKVLSVHNEEQMKKKHSEEILNLVRCVAKRRENIKKVRELVKRQEQEVKCDQESKETQQRKHEEEIAEMIQELLNKTDSNPCPIL